MEKKAVIEPGTTPPEESGVKEASTEALAAHTAQRLAESAGEGLDPSKKASPRRAR